MMRFPIPGGLPPPIVKHFHSSLVVTLLCLALGIFWGGPAAIVTVLMLAVLEVSLSFDNAVVNASVLQRMSVLWQQRFLTWGMLIAVFGMRLVFPIIIVAAVTGMGALEVARLALTEPAVYAEHLHSSHIQVAMFGGAFLMLVFLHFLIDEGKELHWLQPIEARLARLGKLESASVALTLLFAWLMSRQVPAAEQGPALSAAVAGIIIHILVGGLGSLFEQEDSDSAPGRDLQRSSAMSFVYLEVLDASFSFDGVIGAFALTKDVILILCGLTIGAMFVRSLTLHLVHTGTLARYRYLEHGAHWAIGALAVIMFTSTLMEVPELITGTLSMLLIMASLASSIRANRKSGAA